MPIPFRRSTRSIEADSHRGSTVAIAAAGLLLGAWALWVWLARVSVYEISQAARLEVDSAVHSIDSPLSGRVVFNRMTIGDVVQVGDILVELDSETERLQLVEEESRLAARTARLGALRQRRTAEEQARSETGDALATALEEARAKQREALAVARVADEEAARLERLSGQGLVSEMDLVRAKAAAEQHRSTVEARLLNVDRLAKDQRVDQSDRQARVEETHSEIVWLEGEIETERRSIDRLRHEIRRRLVRAAVAGRLGEVANLRAGMVVKAGEKLGAIVPPGILRIVAEFEPSAMGRLEPGQPARMRLDGFPWAEYGMVAATVAKVADEPRDGLVRVELTVHPNSHGPIPMRHGLPGVVEVEVDRISPLSLVLQMGGKLLGQPTAKLERSVNP